MACVQGALTRTRLLNLPVNSEFMKKEWVAYTEATERSPVDSGYGDARRFLLAACCYSSSNPLCPIPLSPNRALYMKRSASHSAHRYFLAK
jgi:hypothetical protein